MAYRISFMNYDMNPIMVALPSQDAKSLIAKFEEDATAKLNHLTLDQQKKYLSQVKVCKEALEKERLNLEGMNKDSQYIRKSINDLAAQFSVSLDTYHTHLKSYQNDIQQAQTNSKSVGTEIKETKALFPAFTPKNHQFTEKYNVTSDRPDLESNKIKCERMITQVIKDLHQCPRAKKLWDEVSQAGHFSIETVSADVEPTGAGVRVFSRVIQISHENDINNIRAHLVFELNNLKRAETLKKIKNNMCKYSDGITYAKEIEKVEYSSGLETNEVMNACRENGTWPDAKPRNFGSLDEYISKAIYYGHSDAYRADWFKQCENKDFVTNLK